MAHVRSAMLCDFAQVREGLLFVSSGGITRVAAPALGAPVSISVAGELEVLSYEAGTTHEITFKEAAIESAIWISIGLAFTGVVFWWHGGRNSWRVLRWCVGSLDCRT